MFVYQEKSVRFTILSVISFHWRQGYVEEGWCAVHTYQYVPAGLSEMFYGAVEECVPDEPMDMFKNTNSEQMLSGSVTKNCHIKPVTYKGQWCAPVLEVLWTTVVSWNNF